MLEDFACELRSKDEMDANDHKRVQPSLEAYAGGFTHVELLSRALPF